MPKVSIIMNCLNNESYLRDTINCVYSQTFTDWEIIFFDDVSDDNSVSIAKSFDDKLKCFTSDKRISLGAARNKAIEKARGEYIAFLDCDDLWGPDKLKVQVEFFEKNKNTGLIYTNVIVFGNQKDLYKLYKQKRCPVGNVFGELLKGFSITMSSVMVRKNCFNENIKFNECFSMIEDYDFFLKVAKKYEFGYINEPLTKWRFHDKSWSQKRHDMFSKEREILLGELLNEDPQIEEKYYEGIKYFKMLILYEKAKSLWRNNHQGEARGIFGKYLFKDRRFFYGWLFSFFKYDFYSKIRNFMLKSFMEEFN